MKETWNIINIILGKGGSLLENLLMRFLLMVYPTQI